MDWVESKNFGPMYSVAIWAVFRCKESSLLCTDMMRNVLHTSYFSVPPSRVKPTHSTLLLTFMFVSLLTAAFLVTAVQTVVKTIAAVAVRNALAVAGTREFLPACSCGFNKNEMH